MYQRLIESGNVLYRVEAQLQLVFAGAALIWVLPHTGFRDGTL